MKLYPSKLSTSRLFNELFHKYVTVCRLFSILKSHQPRYSSFKLAVHNKVATANKS